MKIKFDVLFTYNCNSKGVGRIDIEKNINYIVISIEAELEVQGTGGEFRVTAADNINLIVQFLHGTSLTYFHTFTYFFTCYPPNVSISYKLCLVLLVHKVTIGMQWFTARKRKASNFYTIHCTYLGVDII